MTKQTLRSPWFILLLILILAFLLLGCGDPQEKCYHIKIRKSWFYCDRYEWVTPSDLRMHGCSGHSGTVTEWGVDSADVYIKSCPFK